jgi:hypothetical protein
LCRLDRAEAGHRNTYTARERPCNAGDLRDLLLKEDLLLPSA